MAAGELLYIPRGIFTGEVARDSGSHLTSSSCDEFPVLERRLCFTAAFISISTNSQLPMTKGSSTSPLGDQRVPLNGSYGATAVIVGPATNTPEDPVTEIKSTSKARDAFKLRDSEAMRDEHGKHVEPHKGNASEYVKSIVFGGLDGITTTFAIVAASAGANETYRSVIIFGFSNVLADAFSMGFGEFISGSAERDLALNERKREEWEVETDKDLEKQEMVDIYQKKGLCEDDAKAMVDLISKDDKIFVDFMMVDELGLLPLPEDEWVHVKQGVVMFISFVAFGVLPLLAYTGGKGKGTDWVFGLSCAIVAIALILLGALKGYLTSMSIPKAAFAMLLNGTISGGVSYGVGLLIEYIGRKSTDGSLPS